MKLNVQKISLILFVSSLFFASPATFAQTLYEMPQGVEPRWASGENPTGAKGKGGQTNAGRKGALTVPVKNESPIYKSADR